MIENIVMLNLVLVLICLIFGAYCEFLKSTLSIHILLS